MAEKREHAITRQPKVFKLIAPTRKKNTKISLLLVLNIQISTIFNHFQSILFADPQPIVTIAMHLGEDDFHFVYAFY